MKKIKDLLKDYNKKNFISSKKLNFLGVDNKDVYNITTPFVYKNNKYILGRVEPREHEDKSKVFFFKNINETSWQLDNSLPSFNLQDPFIKKIRKDYVMGGVQIKKNSKGTRLRYRIVFYRGLNLCDMKKFSTGPWGMKDIRIVLLNDGKIGIFTRPKGKIGFTIIKSLNQIKPRMLSNVEIINNQFSKGEWGGVNDAFTLSNGKIGVLGHIAKKSKGKYKHYYPIIFCFDSKSRNASKLKIIFRRIDIPKGKSKSHKSQNIIFPGGIIRENKKAKIYTGVSDAEVYEVTIKDPFIEYEK